MNSPVKVWRNQVKIQKLLNLKGKVISYTRVFVPPGGFAGQAPYVVVVVRLEVGVKYLAQLVDFEPDDLKIGLEVVTVLRRIKNPGLEGVIPYGIKFKPIK